MRGWLSSYTLAGCCVRLFILLAAFFVFWLLWPSGGKATMFLTAWIGTVAAGEFGQAVDARVHRRRIATPE